MERNIEVELDKAIYQLRKELISEMFARVDERQAPPTVPPFITTKKDEPILDPALEGTLFAYGDIRPYIQEHYEEYTDTMKTAALMIVPALLGYLQERTGFSMKRLDSQQVFSLLTDSCGLGYLGSPLHLILPYVILAVDNFTLDEEKHALLIRVWAAVLENMAGNLVLYSFGILKRPPLFENSEDFFFFDARDICIDPITIVNGYNPELDLIQTARMPKSLYESEDGKRILDLVKEEIIYKYANNEGELEAPNPFVVVGGENAQSMPQYRWDRGLLDELYFNPLNTNPQSRMAPDQVNLEEENKKFFYDPKDYRCFAFYQEYTMNCILLFLQILGTGRVSQEDLDHRDKIIKIYSNICHGETDRVYHAMKVLKRNAFKIARQVMDVRNALFFQGDSLVSEAPINPFACMDTVSWYVEKQLMANELKGKGFIPMKVVVPYEGDPVVVKAEPADL